MVVVSPPQPSSSTNRGLESSVPISSCLACPINSQVTDHSGEPCNRTGEVHPVDPFHSLDNFKNHFASIVFCRNSAVYNERSCDTVARCRLDKKVSLSLIDGCRLLSTLLFFILYIAVLTNEA